LLALKGVTKKFGGLIAVNNVSFNIKEGSITGLIGPNGSGKTTLFNLISGLHPLSAGTIKYNEINLSTKKSHEIAMVGIMRTFQIVRPFNDITALDNVIVGAIQKYKSSSEAKEQAIKAMEMLDIIQYKNIKPKNLPLPIKKKLEIARIISTNPKMVLLDETMAGLNPQETEKIIYIIEKINKRGVTVLLVEHKMKCIMKLSHNVIVLNNGSIIAHGFPEEIVNDPEVIRAYLGEDYNNNVKSY